MNYWELRSTVIYSSCNGKSLGDNTMAGRTALQLRRGSFVLVAVIRGGRLKAKNVGVSRKVWLAQCSAT